MSEANDEPRSGSAKDVIRRGAGDLSRRAKDIAAQASERAKDTAEKGYRTMTLRDYRDTMEGTMEKVVEVLAAHEAELAALRRRVEELEAGRES